MFKETWKGLFRSLTSDYSKYDGRMRRRDYFMMHAGGVIAFYLFMALLSIVGDESLLFEGALFVGGSLFIYAVLGILSASMRRLNDIGETRLWVLLPLSSLALAWLWGDVDGMLWPVAIFAVGAWGYFYYLMLKPGEVGDNEHGSNPKPPFVSKRVMMAEYKFDFKDTFFNRYAQFDGRARREEYWMFTLYTVVGLFALEIITSFMGGVGIAIYGIAVTIVGIPSAALLSRRLHDTGRSFWWYLLLLIPFIGVIVLLIFTVQEGVRGPNQYGEDQKALTPEQEKFL